MKKLPFNRTVVTELVVSVADSVSRHKHIKAAYSVALMPNTSFKVGNAALSHGFVEELHPVHQLVIITSFETFYVDLIRETEVIHNVECRGLFLVYGSFSKIVIKSDPGDTSVNPDGVRVDYSYA